MTTEKPLRTTPYCQRVRATGIAARIRSAMRRCVAARRARYVRLAGALSRSRCGCAKDEYVSVRSRTSPCASGGAFSVTTTSTSRADAWAVGASTSAAAKMMRPRFRDQMVRHDSSVTLEEVVGRLDEFSGEHAIYAEAPGPRKRPVSVGRQHARQCGSDPRRSRREVRNRLPLNELVNL